MIFTGGISPSPKLCSDFFSNIIRPDFVIAADSGLETCDSFIKYFKLTDFVPDVILGDMDSIKNKKLVKKYTETKSKTCSFVEFPCDKDFTDSELALILARKIRTEDTKITLIGGSGGRLDHLVALFELFSTDIRPDFWLTENQAAVFLSDGCTVKFHTKKQNDLISVLRTTFSNTRGQVVSEGLEWESDVFRKTGVPSLSNRMASEYFSEARPVKLTAKGGDFVVVAPLDVILD
ncbi:MAG: thiamine pyrophosphokinase [Treponema sp.]|nr:thiamine pyrophosphokinase [Candidatus Treponema merdequi]